MMNKFLPISKKDMEERGWSQVDFVLVTGDAYVDHPSFGAAIVSRILESHGYKVAILAQPRWDTEEDFRRFGKPRLGFLITSGNIDSMVNNYTVAKKRRKKDVYSPGGELGSKPDRGVIVYSNVARRAYKDVPILIGGLEASLRRLAHYDYWDNKVRRSILLDANADLLMYGMGERTIVEVVEALESGIPVNEITFIKGTVYKTKDIERAYDYIELPDYKLIKDDKIAYAESFMKQNDNTDAITAKTLVEPYDYCYVVQNPPSMPLAQSELDRVYGLPYMRHYHPTYEKQGGVQAIAEVKFSLVNNRGCFGSCNFCALAFHQGRVVQSRSHESILKEANELVWEPDFKGYIHDVGGPTANFRHAACDKQKTKGVCKNRQCLFPNPCKQLKIDHKDYINLLRKLREIPNVKKVFVRSGIRYDYLINDTDDSFFYELCEHHVSGQLKVAPEHISPKVLDKMGKPTKDIYEKFIDKYNKVNKEIGKEQYVVPYLMSSHPGSDLKAAVELAEYLRDIKYTPEQVQDFYPTPGTLSTCMYYTGIDPRNMQKVYVPKSPHEKAMQRALMQYRKPTNYELVLEALIKAGRQDLIGFDKKCLIRPPKHKKVPGLNDQKAKDQRNAKKKKRKTIRNVHKKKK
ncbi:YgiQ family radical SAM protein [Vallitalea okinawensis]|uniref:YgiQ family radical SAM protein n=1 Tax=Vallitalea okinawensis TaxID=2078660 RepID=UPI000CFDD7B5